jgi:eukaryotic-like serine/threonine-protein kinase
VLLDMAYIRGDQAAANQQLEAVKGTGVEPFLLFFNAGWQSSLGKIKASRDFWQRASQMAVNSGAKDFGGGLLTFEAYDDALFGLQAESRQEAAHALEISNDPDTRWGAAMALALLGDEQKSASLLAGVQHDAPENYFIQQLVVPEIRAAQQIEKNPPGEAIQLLEALRPYEFGVGPRAVGATPVFMRGMAYLKLHDGAKAAGEFQRILDHRGAVSFGPEYPLSHLNLGRAYALQGDTAKAKTAYQDFFAAWKDADPDVPILKQANAEYEKLK